MGMDQLGGGLVEAWHDVHVAVVDGAGELVAHVGDPDLVTYWRWAAKPFQALPLAADGVLERFAFTTEELALCCASHSSEPQHVAIVRDLLRKIGCGERDLLCGPHPPLSETVARDYASRGVRLTAIYSNCSGKHAGMLALARHHGWPTDFYARGASRAAALSRGSEPLDGRRRAGHQDRGGWLWCGVLWAAAAPDGARLRATGDCGFRIADCGFEGRGSNPQSAIRNRAINAPPPRTDRRLRPPVHRPDARSSRSCPRQSGGRGGVLRAAGARRARGGAQSGGWARPGGGARPGRGAGGAGRAAPPGLTRRTAQREYPRRHGGRAARKWGAREMKRLRIADCGMVM